MYNSFIAIIIWFCSMYLGFFLLFFSVYVYILHVYLVFISLASQLKFSVPCLVFVFAMFVCDFFFKRTTMEISASTFCVILIF